MKKDNQQPRLEWILIVPLTYLLEIKHCENVFEKDSGMMVISELRRDFVSGIYGMDEKTTVYIKQCVWFQSQA